MTDDSHKPPTPLMPDRWPQGDFFICDIFDAAPKGDVASMEHPIFSIATKPDMTPRRYENGGNFVEIAPSKKGLATVHDRDVLIYCISQLMAAINRGDEISQTLRFNAKDMFVATNREAHGRNYERLRDTLVRLKGTHIETNIITGGKEELEGFGLIDNYRVVRETREGRMQEIEVKLSDWVFGAIREKEVLTLSRDYFRLRKPLERRLYEIGRKHCGKKQEQWKISYELLRTKCGSNSSMKEFRRLIGKIIEEDERHDHMPEYAIRRSDDGRFVIFTNRSPVLEVAPVSINIPPLDPEVYEAARMAAPGWDVHMIETEWRMWAKEPPKNPELAFLGFCRRYASQHKLSG